MLNEAIWQKLKKLYEQNPGIKTHNANDQEIYLAQDETGLMFSDFYRYFLKSHQVKLLGYWFMYSLNSISNTDEWSVIRKTQEFGKNFSVNNRQWLIIGSNNNDDLLAMNQKGEVWVLHKWGKSAVNMLAGNFEDFLEQAISR